MKTKKKLTEKKADEQMNVQETKQNDLSKRGSKRDSELRIQFLKERQPLEKRIEDLFVYFGVDNENEDQEQNQKKSNLLGVVVEIRACDYKEEQREKWTFSKIQKRVNSLESNLHNLEKMHEIEERFEVKSSVRYKKMPEWLKCFAKEIKNQTKQLEELERIEDEKMHAIWDVEKGMPIEGKEEEYYNLAYGVYQNICNSLDAYYCWKFGLSYIIAPAALKGVSEWVNEPSFLSPKKKKWWLTNYLELLSLMLDYSWLSFELYFEDYPEYDQTFYEATQMLKKVKSLTVGKNSLTI